MRPRQDSPITYGLVIFDFAASGGSITKIPSSPDGSRAGGFLLGRIHFVHASSAGLEPAT